jgi:hypothetical protein
MKILLEQVVNAYEEQLSEQKVRARHPSCSGRRSRCRRRGEPARLLAAVVRAAFEQQLDVGRVERGRGGH